MTKFELYINSDDRLTLELFLKEDSEFSMNRIHGAGCYGIISEIRNQKILKVKQSANKEDLTIYYENCVLNVNEANITLFKRGAVQLGNDVVKFLQDKKRKEIEKEKAILSNNKPSPLKVTRRNKYNGKAMIATGIILLALIGGIVLHEQSRFDEYVSTESTSYSQQGQFDTSPNLIDNDNLNIFISFMDRSETEKARITKAYYQDTIEKYSKMYGLDPKIIIAIATQERGIHSDKTDFGGATGLMQIQNDVWIGEKLTAYNYEKSKYETVTVKEEDLGDVFKNIKYGCMIFQNCLNYMHNNVLAAIQCYNMGYGNMMKVLESYSLETRKSKNEILEDFSDYGWLEHRNIIHAGDQKYLENVLSWIGNEININSVDNNGSAIKINITNEVQSKNMSFN